MIGRLLVFATYLVHHCLGISLLLDQGGRPNDNAVEGPASINAEERDERFHDRFPEAGEEGEEDDDYNGNNNCSVNDFGQFTAHESSSLNDKGVE
jgi:hypothetical protein